MVEHDLHVLVQVCDRTAGVGHAGRHHEGVELLMALSALAESSPIGTLSGSRLTASNVTNTLNW